jgi:diguanylate cyclase (GGDEF)-like protein
MLSPVFNSPVCHSSLLDPVHALAAQESLRAHLNDAVNRARTHSVTLAVLCVNFSEAERVRATLGDVASEQLLQALAERIRRCARRSDRVARLKDSTWLVIAEYMQNPFAAHRLADRMLEALQEPVQLGGKPMQAGARIGMATGSGDELESNRLLRRAHHALQQALREGRSRCSDRDWA